MKKEIYTEEYKAIIRRIADKNQKGEILTPDERTILKVYFASLRMKYDLK